MDTKKNSIEGQRGTNLQAINPDDDKRGTKRDKEGQKRDKLKNS